MKFYAEMMLAVPLIVVCISFVDAQSTSMDTDTQGSCPLHEYPSYDVRNCHEQQQYGTDVAIQRLEVLPGLGFDNLRNLDMGQVHLYNYSTCKVTEDGKYMIPDSVFVVPLQEGHFKFYADYYDHWDNYTSITSSRVNTGFGGSVFGLLKISGSYSKEKQSVKENQVNYNSKTTRISFRNRVYAVHLDSSAELHPRFKSNVYEIAASVQNNDSRSVQYQSELLVRNYGSHYITSVEAGAVFVKLDSISETYSRNVDRATVTSAASASLSALSFFGSGGLSFGHSRNTTQQNIDAYQSNLKRSEIFTIGGGLFTPNLTLTQWVNDIPNRLAIIDRTADPIHFAITPTRFPELPIPTVRAVSDSVLAAGDRYYRLNTRPGCVDPKAQNFDFQANFDDSSYCNTSVSHIDRAFGGLYQTCRQVGREDLCNDRMIAQVNPQTGDYSCPDGYTAISIHSGTESYVGDYTRYSRTCTGWLSRKCRTRTHTSTEVSTANYETFWCVVITTPVQYRGYLFGGYFTPTSSNPVTGTHSCPPYYRIQKIAVEVSICVSNNYELGSAHAVGFAGFYSCTVGNPLSVPASISTSQFPSQGDWPYNCPRGYSQHLVSIESGCVINVCLEKGAFQSKSLLPPILPPFQAQPPFVPYIVNQLAVLGSDGSVLVRNTAGQWETFSPDSDEASLYHELLRSNSTKMNPPTTPPSTDFPPPTIPPSTDLPDKSETNIPRSSTGLLSAEDESSPPHDEFSSSTIASLTLSTVAVASVIVVVVFVLVMFKVCSPRRHEQNDRHYIAMNDPNE